MTAAAWIDTPRRTLRGVFVAMRLNVIVASQCRVNLAVWLVVSVLQSIVYLSVWQAVAIANGGSTGGYTPAEFAGYFLVVLVVQRLVAGISIVGEFSGYVRRGTLSTHLLRPLHPFAYVFGGMLAFNVQYLLTLPPIFAALFLVFDPQMHVQATSLAAALVLLPLAMLTKVMCDTMVACTSLWLTRIDGLRGMYGLTILLLGGHLAPLPLLPDAMQTIARALPFYWMLGFPTELVIGRAQLADAWIAVAVLGAWSIALYILLQPTWRAGTRAYEAVGT
ncbi:MAG: hypothetical protein JWL76_1535 [Thermoleophilia bacterium]|nr:hypothetical protein [Thermoleophilia bacterium]